MKKIVAGLIPARGGSKGIPRKNVAIVSGKPLIAYTIEAALQSSSLDRVIVSTDDEEIAQVALDHGAEVPFIRPDTIAADESPDIEVVKHLLKWSREEENFKTDIDIIAYLRPTTPLKTSDIIDSAVKKLKNNVELSSVRSVTASAGIHHPYWAYRCVGKVLEPFIDGISVEKYYQRQLLPNCYRLNGVCDVVRAETVLSNNSLYGQHIGMLEISEESSLDIDTLRDLLFFEFMVEQNKAYET